MLRKIRSISATKGKSAAPVFAALGDVTRLSLIRKLSDGRPHSISQLSVDSTLSRQAVTKHLRVLERVGVVHSVRSGRESLFEFDPEPIQELRAYLDSVSQQWDRALTRLQSFVED